LSHSARVSGGWITGRVERPHCSQALIATWRQWARRLSARSSFRRTSQRAEDRGDFVGAQFGGFLDRPVHALATGQALAEVDVQGDSAWPGPGRG
jgi:hypothetical protein